MRVLKFSLICLFLLVFAGLAFADDFATVSESLDYKLALKDVPKSGLEVSGFSPNIVCFSSTECSYVLKVKNESLQNLSDLLLKSYFSSSPKSLAIKELVEENYFTDESYCAKTVLVESKDKNGMIEECSDWQTQKVVKTRIAEKDLSEASLNSNWVLDNESYVLSKQVSSTLNSGEERVFRISFNPSSLQGQVVFIAESPTQTSIKGSLDPWWDSSFTVVQTDDFTGANGTDINSLGKWQTTLQGCANGIDANFKILTDQGKIMSGPHTTTCAYKVIETVPRSTAIDKNWQWRMKWVTDSEAAMTMRIISGDTNNLSSYYAGNDINEIVVQQYFGGLDDGVFIRNKKVITTIPTDGQVVTIRIGRVADTNLYHINIFYDNTQVYADKNWIDVNYWKFAMSTGSTNIQATLTVDDFNVAKVAGSVPATPTDLNINFNFYYFGGRNYLDFENGFNSVIVDFNDVSVSNVFDFNGGQGQATDNNRFWGYISGSDDANSITVDSNADFVKAGSYVMRVDINTLKSANVTGTALYNPTGTWDLTDWNKGTVSFWFCISDKTNLAITSGLNSPLQFLFFDTNQSNYNEIVWDLNELNNGCNFVTKQISTSLIKGTGVNWNSVTQIAVRVREKSSPVDFSFWFDDLKITNPINDWNWYVNGTKFSDDQNTTYTFTSIGDYNVLLKIRDANFNDANITKTVSVIQALQGLAINLDSNARAGDTNIQIDLNSSSSGTPDTWWWQKNGAYTVTTSGYHDLLTASGDYNYCVTAQATGNDINKMACKTVFVSRVIVKIPLDEIDLNSVKPFNVSVDSNSGGSYSNLSEDVNAWIVGLTIPAIKNFYIIDSIGDYVGRYYGIIANGNTQTLQPYLLGLGEASAVKFIVNNELNEPIPNVIFNVSKLIGGNKTLISTSITDITGISLLFLKAGDIYSVDMNYRGKLVFSTSNFVFSTSPVYFYINTLTDYGNITPSNIINVSFNPFVEFIQSGILNIKIDVNGSNANYAILKFYKFPDGNIYADRNYFYVTSKLCPQSCNFTTLISSIQYDGNRQFYAQVTVFSDNNTSQRVWEKRYSKFSSALNPITLFINARKDFGCSTDTNLPCPLTSIASIILIILAIGAIAIKFGFSEPVGLGVFALLGLTFFTYVGWFYWVAWGLIAIALVLGLVGKLRSDY